MIGSAVQCGPNTAPFVLQILDRVREECGVDPADRLRGAVLEIGGRLWNVTLVDEASSTATITSRRTRETQVHPVQYCIDNMM